MFSTPVKVREVPEHYSVFCFLCIFHQPECLLVQCIKLQEIMNIKYMQITGKQGQVLIKQVQCRLLGPTQFVCTRMKIIRAIIRISTSRPLILVIFVHKMKEIIEDWRKLHIEWLYIYCSTNKHHQGDEIMYNELGRA